ncbi:MAG: class I SAM-dependent methyltransferase [Methanobrevibacter sp.]|jgi:regulator of replication initiation timing|nr:class I SAM-dependent methyltransferase [Candidatus Methanovirga australis]
MHRFWEYLIEPIFKEFGIKNIVEIGSEGGGHTNKLINYAKNNNGIIYSIDPFPKYDYKDLESKYKNNFKQYVDLSLNVLPLLKNIDAVLIDGDHNWYSVFNELKIIDNDYEEFPLVFFHDTSWPYARRDLYYNPETIPDEFRHQYQNKGMLPKQNELATFGYNKSLYNAIHEGGEKNGVLTAIEDFIEYSEKEFDLYSFNIYHGLSLLIPKDKSAILKDMKILSNVYPTFLQLSENLWWDSLIQIFEYQEQLYNENLRFNDLSNKFNDLSNKFNVLNEQNNQIRSKATKLEQKNKKLNKKNEKLNKKLLKKIEKIEKQKTTIKNKDILISQYSNSFSWKITKPIRYIGKLIRKLIRK